MNIIIDFFFGGGRDVQKRKKPRQKNEITRKYTEFGVPKK